MRKYLIQVVFGMHLVLTMVMTASAAPVFDFPNDKDFILIEYSQSVSMIQDQDKQPLLRIYGDGTVLVHFPVYMKRAGDYTMQLNNAELLQLLLSFDSKGVFRFDKSRVNQLVKQSKDRKLLRSNETSYRSEESISNIHVNLLSYIPDLSGSPRLNIKQSISWKNLKWDSQEFADVPELVNAAAVETQLQQLLNHDRLTKIK